LFLFPVAKPSNASPSTPPDAAPPSFEAAMERLETIVEAMEAGDVPLADLLSQYEEGAKLIAHCEARLKTAELKIEQLKRQRDGSVRLDPFAATETPESA
jgi:exodeoxyribonuclease VII small subunit